jgi:hypothetical protein
MHGTRSCIARCIRETRVGVGLVQRGMIWFKSPHIGVEQWQQNGRSGDNGHHYWSRIQLAKVAQRRVWAPVGWLRRWITGLNICNVGMLKSSIKGISKGHHAPVHVAMRFPRVDRAGWITKRNLHNQVSSGVGLKEQTRIGQRSRS